MSVTDQTWNKASSDIYESLVDYHGLKLKWAIVTEAGVHLGAYEVLIFAVANGDMSVEAAATMIANYENRRTS